MQKTAGNLPHISTFSWSEGGFPPRLATLAGSRPSTDVGEWPSWGIRIMTNATLLDFSSTASLTPTQFLKIDFNPFKTEGILRKFQKVIQHTQKWKDFKNNGMT
jgi:hypothetical protein